MILAACLAGAGTAPAAEIAFDHGGEQKSTVIGLYRPEGSTYILASDFSIMAPATLASTVVRVRAHVGSDLKTVAPKTEPQIAVRVNGGPWRWQSLAPYGDDGHHWVEVGVPVEDWIAGLNRVEVNSNVSNPSNRTRETLDLLACDAPPLLRRSSCSLDLGRTFSVQADRNWGIRLRTEERPEAAHPAARLELEASTDRAAVNERVQYVARAFDKDGNPVSAAGVEWSATGGGIDDWGLFQPATTGTTTVRAALGSLVAERRGEAFVRPPAGIEAPGSPMRLAPAVADGDVSLAGPWGFRLDPDNVGEAEEWHRAGTSDGWGEIAVPGAWQAQGYGIDYHGVGWYRRALEVPGDWAGKNVWIQFAGASTKATVWLNGVRVGEHLGNWAPFTLGLSEHWKAAGNNVLVVRVEELPNHFSAGFPREIGRFGGVDSHFGGLWQNVTLHATGAVQIDDLYVHPRLGEKQVRVRASLRTKASSSPATRVICAIEDPDGNRIAAREERLPPQEGGTAPWSAPKDTDIVFDIPRPRVWSPDSPALYKAIVEVYDGDRLSDRSEARFGMRSVERRGTQILLNGEPLMVRGVLHWGYYPDLFSIDPSEDRIRKEFEDLRGSGFNLVKVCLFNFPRRFYEIADETGMLLWQEYPTWLYVNFPKAGDTRLDADFAREYPEWFRYDRGHASIILRDLTCEAHIDPNFDLLERTYKVGKKMLDGAMLCDNSSFFKHRITDWYVCHTYRDLDEYHDYLAELVGKMRSAPETKPFLFGEDFDADTYRDTQAIRERFMKGETPWWLANANFEGQMRFESELRAACGEGAPARLVEMQKKHGMALRKAYMEEFRRYPEPAGFVMTSLRDITVTRPGFYDDLGQPKWSPDAWKDFNAERVLVLHAERRSRCFAADEPVAGEIVFSNYGADIPKAPLHWKLSVDGKAIASGKETVSAGTGDIVSAARFDAMLPGELAKTATPLLCQLEAWIGNNEPVCRNSWSVWVFPSERNAAMAADSTVYAYSPNDDGTLASRHPGVATVPVRPSGDASGGWQNVDTGEKVDLLADNTVLLSEVVDDSVRNAVAAGARAIHLATGDDASFLPRQEAPFWRETAVWLPSGSVLGDFPHEGFVDLQFLDLTQRKPFARPASADPMQHLVWGVSARHPGNPPFDYIVQTGIGTGSLLACCLNLSGENNVAGHHLLRCLVDRMSTLPRGGKELAGP